MRMPTYYYGDLVRFSSCRHYNACSGHWRALMTRRRDDRCEKRSAMESRCRIACMQAAKNFPGRALFIGIKPLYTSRICVKGRIAGRLQLCGWITKTSNTYRRKNEATCTRTPPTTTKNLVLFRWGRLPLRLADEQARRRFGLRSTFIVGDWFLQDQWRT